MRTRLFLAALALSSTGPIPTAALAQIEPISIQEARDHPGCGIYLKPDGSRLLYKGHPITPYGPCPEGFLRGRVTRYGPQTYLLEIPGRTCVMYPNGYGRCEPPAEPESQPESH